MDYTNKKAILFDLDGTLTDSSQGIINSLKYALKAYNICDYDEKMLDMFLGPPLLEVFQVHFGFDKTKALEAVEVYREYFREKGIFENRLYEGIETMLKSLAADGRQLILATSKAEVFAIKILEHFNIQQYFSVVAGSNLDGTRIHKDEVIHYALEKAGITDKCSALMVGDRKYDILGAKEAGLDSIGVLYGYGNREEFENAGASLIVDTVDDLLEALLGKKESVIRKCGHSDLAALVETCKSQFFKCFAMLENLMEQCPQDIWGIKAGGFVFWQQILHTLTGTSFWMRMNGGLFSEPFQDRKTYPELDHQPEDSVSKAEMIEFKDTVKELCEEFFDGKHDEWLILPSSIYDKLSNIDVIFMQIRHIQYHVGHCDSILRERGLKPAEWVD